MPATDRQDTGRWSHAWTATEGEARAWDLLRDTFGESAERMVSAPGMVAIIGDHTDYSRGISLPTVVSHRTFIAASPRADSEIRIVRDIGADLPGPGAAWFGDLKELTPGGIPGWPARSAGVLWGLQERGYSGCGMNIAIVSCVPIRMGLSSSGALSGAVSLAANEVWGLALDSAEGKRELAEACVEGESAFVGTPNNGAPSGGLDLHTVLRCPPGDALLLDFRTTPPGAIETPLYFPDYGLSLMLIDTRSRPDSNTDISNARRAECAAAARALGVETLRDLEDAPHPLRAIEGLEDPVLRKRARHVLHEIERVRLVMGEIAGTGPAHERFVAVGKAMYRSHASLDLDFDLSSEVLNLTVDSAFEAGALGAHLTAWGRGGAVVALVRRAEVYRIADAIDRAYSAKGLELPHYALA